MKFQVGDVVFLRSIKGIAWNGVIQVGEAQKELPLNDRYGRVDSYVGPGTPTPTTPTLEYYVRIPSVGIFAFQESDMELAEESVRNVVWEKLNSELVKLLRENKDEN